MPEIPECKRCGWCCEHIIISSAGILSDHQIEWCKARGIQIDGQKMIIPSHCPALVYRMGIAFCDIHNYKPVICDRAGCDKPKEFI